MEFYLTDGVKQFTEKNGKLQILLNSGTEIQADLAVLSIGVKPENSLEEMLGNAIQSGVSMIACQMSMDGMGVKKEELLDNVDIGGVANYLEAASAAGINLFI